MKKIALFSLLLCVCTVNVFGDEPIITQCDGDFICRRYEIGGPAESTICSGKSKNYDCTSNKAGAKRALCIENGSVLSCAARECDNDHILWLTNTRGGKQSQGKCFNRASLNSWCNQGCGCQPGQECVLKEIDFKVVDKNYTTKAFVGEEACHCVGNPTTPPKKMCDAFVNIYCANGQTYNAKFSVAESEIFDAQGNALDCNSFRTEIEKHNIKFRKADNTELNWSQIVTNKCQELQNGNNGGTTVNNAQEAYNRLQAFFNAGKADVWKDSEGKFNTARLASDLTAGVVLGTVGGVVSGVVIKKKQVEKGFDALHCTVGGQTVADWGDEFMVGISK